VRELRILCDKCGGSGWIRDENGVLDVCNNCWGLGYVETSSENGLDAQLHVAMSRNSIISILAGMGIYYAIVFFLTRNLKLNFIYTFLLIFFGYYAGIIANGIYLHLHERHLRSEKHSRSS
jgi:hypothetical protein